MLLSWDQIRFAEEWLKDTLCCSDRESGGSKITKGSKPPRPVVERMKASEGPANLAWPVTPLGTPSFASQGQSPPLQSPRTPNEGQVSPLPGVASVSQSVAFHKSSGSPSTAGSFSESPAGPGSPVFMRLPPPSSEQFSPRTQLSTTVSEIGPESRRSSLYSPRGRPREEVQQLGNIPKELKGYYLRKKEAASRVTLWEYCPEDGKPEVTRMKPEVDSSFGTYCLRAGDVLRVVEEREDDTGCVFLRLQGDKGWFFSRTPDDGEICKRQELAESDHEALIQNYQASLEAGRKELGVQMRKAWKEMPKDSDVARMTRQRWQELEHKPARSRSISGTRMTKQHSNLSQAASMGPQDSVGTGTIARQDSHLDSTPASASTRHVEHIPSEQVDIRSMDTYVDGDEETWEHRRASMQDWFKQHIPQTPYEDPAEYARRLRHAAEKKRPRKPTEYEQEAQKEIGEYYKVMDEKLAGVTGDGDWRWALDLTQTKRKAGAGAAAVDGVLKYLIQCRETDRPDLIFRDDTSQEGEFSLIEKRTKLKEMIKKLEDDGADEGDLHDSAQTSPMTSGEQLPQQQQETTSKKGMPHFGGHSGGFHLPRGFSRHRSHSP